VTNPLTGAPYTRRELREREQLGQSVALAGPLEPAEVAKPQTPEIAHTPEPATPVAPTLSRREARALQAQSASPMPVGDSSPSPLVELVQALPALVTPVPEPLPPVFSAPGQESVPMNPPASGATPVVSFQNPADAMTTTSSLIIPVTPVLDLAGPLGHTGEIVATGQISLPAKAVSRGTIPLRLEDEEKVDSEVMDAYITGEIGAMTKPLRATQAVSGRGDDSEFLLIKKTRWGTGVIVSVLLVSGLALAAATMLALSLATGVLL